MVSHSKLPTWPRKEKTNTLFKATYFCCFVILTLTLIFFVLGISPNSNLLCGFHGRSSSVIPSEEQETSLNSVSMQAHMDQRKKKTMWKTIPSLSRNSLLEFDCEKSLQIGPVVAHKVEKLDHPFFISIADLGTFEKPNRNFQRILKGKLFQKPSISETVQNILGQKQERERNGGVDNVRGGADGLEINSKEEERKYGSAKEKERYVVIDVGANIGMATFAATSMGYNVLAFEPVLENVQKICDGIYLNRASSSVKLYHLAVSDTPGHITMHKVMGRLDNSAVSASGAKLAFKSNDVVPITIQSVTLDSMIPPSMPVLLLKIDVQGWEYHVLKGASELLSRPPPEAPYIIYEDDEKLLRESNSTSDEILRFLARHGYQHCSKKGGDQHCTKEKSR